MRHCCGWLVGETAVKYRMKGVVKNTIFIAIPNTMCPIPIILRSTGAAVGRHENNLHSLLWTLMAGHKGIKELQSGKSRYLKYLFPMPTKYKPI